MYARNRTPAAAAALIERLGCASFGVNEAQWNLRELRATGLRLHEGEHGEQRRGYADTPVLVRPRFEAVGELSVKLCDAVPGQLKYAPDRWATTALYRHPRHGTVAHTSVHFHAGLNFRHGRARAELLREYARGVDSLRELLAYLERTADVSVVTGDVNLSARSESASLSWSPYRMLEARGYDVKSRGVDLVAVGPGYRVAKLRTLRRAAERVGADHPWLVASVRKAGAR